MPYAIYITIFLPHTKQSFEAEIKFSWIESVGFENVLTSYSSDKGWIYEAGCNIVNLASQFLDVNLLNGAELQSLVIVNGTSAQQARTSNHLSLNGLHHYKANLVKADMAELCRLPIQCIISSEPNAKISPHSTWFKIIKYRKKSNTVFSIKVLWHGTTLLLKFIVSILFFKFGLKVHWDPERCHFCWHKQTKRYTQVQATKSTFLTAYHMCMLTDPYPPT